MLKIKKLILYLTLLSFVVSCVTIPKGAFDAEIDKGAPNYADLNHWAASPLKKDQADQTPGGLYQDNQEKADADVFFVHPTTYTKEKGNSKWNADLSDQKLNKKTDKGSIRFQASVFNGAAKIYAPRYRQAHIYVFFNKKEENKAYAKKALDFANQDVKTAFEYYLEHHNKGRPIIIAGHSQGTLHAVRLINDFFDGKPLMEKLVASYLVGMPVRTNTFESLPACEEKDDIGCYTTWRSYQRGYLPKWHEANSNIVVTNPLSWTIESNYIPMERNKGTVLFKFEDGVSPGIADAQIYEDHLWVNKPKFKGSIFVTFKNYHPADYNLFYVSIRENVILRVKKYLEKK